MSEPDFSKIISKEMARARHDGAADERAAILGLIADLALVGKATIGPLYGIGWSEALRHVANAIEARDDEAKA